MSKANSVMGSSTTRREDERPESPAFYMSVDVSALQQGKLKLPQDFDKKFEGKVPKQCRLVTLSGTWHVDLKNIGGELFLKKGWKEFVAGNHLKLGEQVVFYYTGDAEFYAEVYGLNHCSRRSSDMTNRLVDEGSDEKDVISIDSNSDSEPQNSESSLETKTKCLGKSGCGKKKSRLCWSGRTGNIATRSRSGNPCFSVRMCQTHLTKGPMLTPRSFMRNIYKPKKVELQVGKLTWKVTWIHPCAKSSRFSRGWLLFVKQNGVKEGNFCDFELISKTFEVAVMKVTIRRM